MYYLHGLPMGRIILYIEGGAGNLLELFRSCAPLFEGGPRKLIEEYRDAPVKNADETACRTDGKNGHVWLFATPKLSIFQLGKSRSLKIPKAVLGRGPLPRALVVDCYAGYIKTPSQIQYCCAHLLREVLDLEKEFLGEADASSFVAVVALQLSVAMGLRGQAIPDEVF
jgi:transposase